MKLKNLSDAVSRAFSDKNKLINLVLYLLFFGLIWYFCDLGRSLKTLLFFVGVLVVSTFLTELVMVIRLKNSSRRAILASSILTICVAPLTIFFLSFQVLGYLLALGVIIAGVSFYSSN